MTVQRDQGAGLLNIDELAASVGMTVRNTRYYASLGLLPPPVRRGRMAFYDGRHQARLSMVRALQEHGFTLQAVERYMAELPTEASAEELALQRAMLTSWSPSAQETLTRRQLERRAGRRLGDDDVEILRRIGTIEPDGDRYVVLPTFSVGVELLGLDIPVAAMEAASDSITRHMESLAAELTDVLHTQVLEPFRREEHRAEDAAEFERTMSRLRQLTLEAVVTGFQRAANVVIRRSLARN